MMGEKSIKKTFSEICDGELTNLEIDDFIKKSIEGYELPKLKRLIIEYEQFMIQEKPEYLIFFEYLFGDRAKITNDVKVSDEDALNQVIEDYKIKYKNSPETIHSHCEKESEATMPTDFSPVLNEVAGDSYNSSKVNQNYSDFISVFGPGAAISFITKSILGVFSVKVTGPLLLAYMLGGIGGKRVSKSIKKFTVKFLSDDTNCDFASDLKTFMDSPAHHFYVKLHTLYHFLNKTKSSKNSSQVSQTSTPYNADKPSRKYPPNVCAKLYLTKHGARKFGENEITFVMKYADDFELIDNVSELIRMVKAADDCPKRIKKKKDIKAESEWIRFFDSCNEIDRKKRTDSQRKKKIL